MLRCRPLPIALPLLFLCAGVGSSTTVDEEPPVSPRLLAGLEYRLIGPYRGGRVTTVTGIPEQPFTFYLGSTGGGVWKTSNAGQTWENVSDGFIEVGSIGAVAVAPSDPNVVYVGTGSACPRGNVSVGDGVYGSTDGGKSFRHLGLPEAGQIGRIQIDPRDPDRVFVAALGHIFGSNEERGVYRSRDGGGTWEQVLYVSELTGAVDLAMDPKNPRILFAAMWRVERKPWTLVDGGDESGLYRSRDGGTTWTRLEGGLPQGDVGRIGVSVSPQNPERVFALVTAAEDRGGVFRSDDGGDSFTRVSEKRDLLARGWYYSHIHAAPHDENTVFVSNGDFFRSTDGGKGWEEIRTPHGDNHDLWINPLHPEIWVQANDGGANVTLDGGRNWSTLNNQPTAEFYRVTVDEQFPYRVYGAQQDNTTISVPAWSGGALAPEAEWFDVAGGESGHIAVSPVDPDLVYAGSYIGRIDRYDHRTGMSRNVVLYPQMQDGTAPRDLEYRFQWNAPILISRHDPEIVYHTSNYVHRTRDSGMSWETISPDLTRNDAEKQELPGGPVQHDHTGVEVWNTIFAFAESPHEAGELWAGADDGLVFLTRDDGANWREITPPAMPLDATVNSIELCTHRPGRAWVAAHRYRLDDFFPYVFRTDDYGETWTLLSDGTNGIPSDHPVRVVREDPDREGLLYAGTEFGMFVSFDAGERWQPFQLELPRTPITDLVVHRQDLVVATQGRSFWILDDLTPLHQLSEQVEESSAWLFAPRPAYRTPRSGFRKEIGPESAPDGATLYFYLAEAPDEEVRLEILDADGQVLRQYSSAAKDDPDDDEDWPPVGKLEVEQGLNRVVWDLKTIGPHLAKGAVLSLSYRGGPYVSPGLFSVRLTMAEWSQTVPLEVRKDPRLEALTQDDLDAQYELVIAIRDRLTSIHDRIRALRSVREQIDDLGRLAASAGLSAEDRERLAAAAESSRGELDAAEAALIQPLAEVSQDAINFPPRIDNQFAYLYTHVYRAYGRPTAGTYARLEDLEREVQPLLERAGAALGRTAELNALLGELGLAGVVTPVPPPSS